MICEKPKTRDLRSSVMISALMILASSCAAFGLAPTHVVEKTPALLSTTIPDQFMGWRSFQDNLQQVSLFAVDENGQNPMNEVYDDSLLRTYIDPQGGRMMLAIAYDRVQREEDRVHRPEICYIAQGFSIISDEPMTFNFSQAFPPIEGRQMLTQHGPRLEAVTYWIRTGDSFSQNPWRSRIYVLTEGLAGRLHDGILVRISEIVSSQSAAQSSFKRQQLFLISLLTSLDPATSSLLARHVPGAHK